MEKVLIIDDFEPVRKVIKRIVERENFIAFQACDGKEGLEVFERERPDVIITDLKMPNIDGKGVLCAVKNQHPETEVIVLTGYGDNEMSNFLMKNGAFSYLKKPLDLHQLVKILADVRNKIRKNNISSDPLSIISQSDDDISIHLTPRGKIKILWEGETRDKARQFMTLGAGSLALPLIVADGQCRIRYANHAFEKMIGSEARRLDEPILSKIRSHGIHLTTSQKFFDVLNQLQNETTGSGSADIDSLGDLIIFKIFEVKGTEEIPLFVMAFPMLMA